MLLAQVGSGQEITFGWLFAKMIIAMIVIIILAFLTIKYVLPKIVRLRQKSDSSIQILDFQPIEQRKSIYLLKIENKKIAIGVTDHSVAKLCEWEENSG